jgi:hypothetical protein
MRDFESEWEIPMRKPLTTSAVLLATVTVLSSTALAQPNYTYVDLSYVRADLDRGPTVDGFGVDGSLRVSNELHLVGGYERLTGSNLTVDLYRVGLGYQQALVQGTDFVARGGLARTKIDANRFGSDSDNGWFAQAGVRSALTDSLELNAFLTHSDAGGSRTSIDVGGVYYVTSIVGITLGASFSDDENIYKGGIRFAF